MKQKQVLLITMLLGFMLLVTQTADAQGNRPFKRQLTGAVQRMQRNGQVLVCNAKTTKLVVYYSNSSLPEYRPYTMTLDKNGIRLHVECDGRTVHDQLHPYRGTTFSKVLAKVTKYKIKKSATHGDYLVGAPDESLTAYRGSNAYFKAENQCGRYNVRGDLDGLLDYLRSLIPNFFEIVDG